MKTKTCKVCKSQFVALLSMATVCSPACALALAVSKRGKAVKVAQIKERKDDKVKLKRRADWLKEAQDAVNKYVRLRDDKEPCISCGRHHTGQYHAGHYLSVGARPELRFHTNSIRQTMGVQ